MNFYKVLREIKVFRLLLVIGGVSTTVIMTIYYFTNNVAHYALSSNNNSKYPKAEPLGDAVVHQRIESLPRTAGIAPEKYNEGELKNRLMRDKIKSLTGNGINNKHKVLLYQELYPKYAKLRTKNIHIFYSFPVRWFKNGLNDGNATRLPLQKPAIMFYPQLGLYQSDLDDIQNHIREIKNLGIDVIIVSWSPAVPQHQIHFLLNIISKHGLQMAIQIENYTERNVFSLFNNIAYIYKQFWFHDGLYKLFVQSKKKPMPMIYIQEADSIPDQEWMKLLTSNGVISLRRSLHDAVIIGDISTKKHVALMRRSGFNGFYNNIPSNGASYISTWKNWEALKKSADKYKLLFIPTVSPGYNEDKKQPKVGSLRRHRTNGQYFGVAWRTAISISAQFVAVSSFNDWLAGTQVEEAIPKTGYRDYLPGAPTKYLDLTRYWVNECITAQIQLSDKTDKTDSNICQHIFNNTIC